MAEILVRLFGRGRGERMVSTPHLRPLWANLVMRLNEKTAAESAIPEETRRFLVEQTRDTCRRTLDRFDKWRDWGYEPGA
jgi:hypothetical protein